MYFFKKALLKYAMRLFRFRCIVTFFSCTIKVAILLFIFETLKLCKHYLFCHFKLTVFISSLVTFEHPVFTYPMAVILIIDMIAVKMMLRLDVNCSVLLGVERSKLVKYWHLSTFLN